MALPCSVIIPAKNEALSLGSIIDGALKYAQEVIVVDGHSTDHTSEVVKAAGAQMLKDSGKGKGEAMRIGAAAATQPILLFIDADGSHDPGDIPRLVLPIVDDQADIVIGSRMRGGSDELSGSWNMLVRLVGSQLITLAINWRWKTKLTDSQNGFRAIRRETFIQLDLRENSFAIEQEMLMRALKAGCRVMEVPTHEYKRLHGESHIRLRAVWWHYLSSWIKGMAF